LRNQGFSHDTSMSMSLTAEDALRYAEAEGLTLLRSDSSCYQDSRAAV